MDKYLLSDNLKSKHKKQIKYLKNNNKKKYKLIDLFEKIVVPIKMRHYIKNKQEIKIKQEILKNK